MYGVIEYDINGLPICEICGGSFNRVTSHVRQVHDMSAREYKEKFGFDVSKGICSIESSRKSRLAVIINWDKVVVINLLIKGEGTQFTKGDNATKGKKKSKQSCLRVSNELKKEKHKKRLTESGKKLGKSGLGNKVRWNNCKQNKEKQNES